MHVFLRGVLPRRGSRVLPGRGSRVLPRRERGASAVEYALLVAAIAAVVIAIVLGMASIVRDAFDGASDCVTSGGTSTSCPSPSG